MRWVRICVWVVGMGLGAMQVEGGVNAGTVGAALPEGRSGDNCVVILGDLAPTNGASGKYLGEAVKEINLLRPAAVLTVGGLVERTGDGKRYGEEVEGVRGVLGKLGMPWYPCVGTGDVEGEYEKRMGPLYYSVDIGGIHAIVLDSEEEGGQGNGLSEGQLEWLRGDLNKTFEAGASGGGVKWVVVLMHRPLWRMGEKSNWGRVQRMLVEFNRRPIVSVEGGDVVRNGPRVVGVWAGEAREYSQEPMREGIRYTVVGATAARIDQDAAVAIRHFSVVKLDEQDGGVHPALVLLGGSGGMGAIVGEDIVTARERGVLDAIAALPNEVMGVEGAVDLSGGAATQPAAAGLWMNVGNPLEVPLEVQVRLASARNLATATERENANPTAEHLDAPWEMDIPHQIRHLEPGAKERWPLRLTWEGKGEDAVPAQVEFVVRWAEGEKQVREVVVKRRVAVVPRAEIPVAATVEMRGEKGWGEAAEGKLFAWAVHAGEAETAEPEWAMVADGERLFVRVRVDGVGRASDVLSVEWAGAEGKTEEMRVVPWGVEGVSQSVGKRGEAVVERSAGGYVVTCALPREWVFGAGKEGRVNLSLSEEEQGSGGEVRSWTVGASAGNSAARWGRVALKDKQ